VGQFLIGGDNHPPWLSEMITTVTDRRYLRHGRLTERTLIIISKKAHLQLQNDPEKGATKHKQRKRNGSFFDATEMMTQARRQIEKNILFVGVFSFSSVRFVAGMLAGFVGRSVGIDGICRFPCHLADDSSGGGRCPWGAFLLSRSRSELKNDQKSIFVS
jgi:hypothetical protein